MICDLFFATPAWHDLLDINNEEILNFCLEKRKKCKGKTVSNVNGWQSEDFIPEDQSLVNLCLSIKQRAKDIINQYGFKWNQSNLKIYNMWINVNNPGSLNKIHIHHNSILSGVYYVKCNFDSGNLIFHRNFIEEFSIFNLGEIENTNFLSHSEIHYAPEEKKLILFPSFSAHSVGINKSNEERISISFNIGM